ncbi:deoxyguanosinetriphosphate triphosphohydrolase family protein [Methanococcoides alaskense]|uniref:DGTPase n=1 Tax=Methanococcoides alaskense TaxID=325778 RepID=A0AA90Z5T2_9EURY|nr:dNTP triphosphohydrolase [Methanococcoides alaskense]MDA0525422.1 dNTP triphosphohydrolase [Methanococcoides alaskense]MDR6221645.1 dGTPase [Methanococcoides alaskense]
MISSSDLKQEFKESDRFYEDANKDLSLKDPILQEMIRSEFGRDRDRIFFSRAFRRLQHKAQIYSNEKGDHYRTRLTHTLEVSQLSRSLARYLSVNEDLVEAIAIGHDIGHTPFGHEGERVLDDVMSGNDNLGMTRFKINHGGFKHNFNSVRVLDITTLKYQDKPGLNLSWQVLEGILKHTRTKRCKEEDCTKCGNCWDIKRFIHDKKLIDTLYLDFNFSVTLEGQIVSIADEIAQRQHDLDDGLRDASLRLDSNDVYSKIISFIGEIVDAKPVNCKSCSHQEKVYLNDCYNSLDILKNKLEVNKESKNKLYMIDSLVRDIIEYFIIDVYRTTNYNISISELDISRTNACNGTILDKNLVSFSELGTILDNKIESYINHQIINSHGVNMFDGKSKFIIRQLCKAYYNNPLQMPSYVLMRLEKAIRDKFQFYGIDLRLSDIFKNGTKKDITMLIKLLKLDDIPIIYMQGPIIKNPYDINGHDKESIFESINKIGTSEIENDSDRFVKWLLENNYAYLSTICDYIAGMTDNYAKDEYKKLYLVD